MRFGALSATHPTYDAKTWEDYEAIYRGGKFFRARVGSFLRPNPMEPSDVYEQRKREARFRSYAGAITNFFASQLLAAPMTVRKLDPKSGDSIEPDSFYALLEGDVDGLGMDIVELARRSFRDALIKQWVWWLAALPENDGRSPVNRAEWEARELGRAVLLEIDPERVLDWEYDDDGELLWAVVYSAAAGRASIAESRSTVRHTWRVYDREGVETFELLHDPAKDPPLRPEDEIPSKGRAAHGFPRVPLVRLCLPEGLWLLNQLADTQLEHFRLSSALSWAIRRTCYAMPIFKAREDPPAMGPGYFLRIQPDEDVAWAAPPSAPFAVIAEAIKSEKDEIYRVSQQMAQGVDNNAAAVGRSGQSKLADANATEVCLKAYGAILRDHIERAFELVADGRHDESVRFSVEGLERFNLSDAQMVVQNAVSAEEINIPSATFKKELFIQTAEALLPGLEQTKKDALRNEIDENVDALMKAQAEARDRATAPQPAQAPQPSNTNTRAAQPSTGNQNGTV